MTKLIAFDLDNTLAPHGKPISQKTITQLREIEKMGVLIAICSGKSAFYLSGFLRQVELNNPIIIGENGAEMKVGINLPPTTFNLINIPNKTIKKLSWVEKKIRDLFNNNIWFQHNRFSVSPFPTNQEGFEKIDKFIAKNKRKLKGIHIYKHPDCFDFVPVEVNKKKGLENLLSVLKINASDIIAVGDSLNDYPMFELAGFSVGVNVKHEEKVNVNFETINEAMNFILNDKLIKK